MNAPSRDGRGRDSCWRPDGSQFWTSLCGLAPFQATDDALEELLLKAKWISVLDLFLSTALRKELSSLNSSLCLAQKLLLMARLVSVLTDFLHEPAISKSVSVMGYLPAINLLYTMRFSETPGRSPWRISRTFG